MIMATSYKDKKITVLGLGRSGQSVVKGLLEAGAEVFAWDDQEKVRNIAKEKGIPLVNPKTLQWKEMDHLILSPGIPHRFPAPHPVVARAQGEGIRPLSDLEVFYQSHPDSRYIGVTGTNGKSTTTTLIGHILKSSHMPCEIGGNLGVPVMDLKPLGKQGTYVLEVSSYQLEISPSLHFDVSILLNITPDHLERHGGMEGYIEAKKLIFKNSKPADTLVIGVDDPHCLTIYESLKNSGSVKLVPISICRTLREGVYVKDGILYEESKEILDLRSLENLKGQHNWQNVAATYGALRAIGIESGWILKGLSSFPGLVHRQQKVADYKNVTFINDSKATNGEAAAKALLCYQDSPLYWIVGGRPKEGGIARLKPFFPNIEHAFLYGEAGPAFELTLEDQVPYTLCETLKEAVDKAAVRAFDEKKPNATILLSPACASFDQYKDFEVRGIAFCDYVQEAIALEQRK